MIKRGDIFAGKYRVDEPLSKRGTRQKWLATSTADNLRVVTETLHEATINDENELADLRYEIALSQQLNHPSFVKCIDSFVEHDSLMVVWEYVDAVELTNNLALDSLSDQELAQLLRRMIQALDFAHQKNIYHGALSSDSILVTPNLTPVFVGFRQPGSVVETDPGLGSGISQYRAAAPEIMEGNKPSAASDLYSVGVIAKYLFDNARIFRNQYQGSTKNSQVAANRKVLEAIDLLTDYDPTRRMFGAQTILEDDFLSDFSTPPAGVPVVELTKRQAKKIKRSFDPNHQRYARDRERTRKVIAVIVFAALPISVALTILYLLSQTLGR